MLNTIAIGLAALSNFTGFSPLDIEYNLPEASITKICEQNRVSLDEYDDLVCIQKPLYSIHGNHEYELVVLNNDNYYIVDNKDGFFVDDGLFIDSPFYHHENDFIVYKNGVSFYYEPMQDVFLPLSPNECFYSFDDLFYSYEYSRSFPYTDVNCVDTNWNNVTKISNYKYFVNLKNYGRNANGICSLIADQMVFGYYDSFLNDNVVDESCDMIGYSDNASLDVSTWIDVPGTGNRIRDQKLANHLTWVHEQINLSGNSYVDGTGLSCQENQNVIEGYLSLRSINHASYRRYNYDTLPLIEQSINLGLPIVSNGCGHTVVAFGYDDNYIYINIGWGFCAKTPRSTFVSTDGVASAIFLAVYSGHSHSNNFYSTYYNTFVCPCGHTDSSIGVLKMDPEDWDYARQYYFYEKTKSYSFSSIPMSMETKRKRTGCIPYEPQSGTTYSKYINLSPRRSGAGSSYFSITTSKYLLRFKVEMAWWSEYEYENDGNAYIFCMGSSNLWTLNYINIHNDLNLKHSKIDTEAFLFNLPSDDDYHGIKFQISNLATGDRNKGRLSLGRIELFYSNSV